MHASTLSKNHKNTQKDFGNECLCMKDISANSERSHNILAKFSQSYEQTFSSMFFQSYLVFNNVLSMLAQTPHLEVTHETF